MKKNKQMRDLLTEMEAKKNAAKSAAEAGDTQKAASIMKEVDALCEEYKVQESIVKSESFFEANAVDESEPAETMKTAKGGAQQTAVQKFFEAARNGFPKVTKSKMSEGVATDGGYTVPTEIVTKVERFRESQFSLRNLVTNVSVSAPTGTRTFLKKSSHTGFSEIAEGGKVTKKSAPQFDRIPWNIKKYGGYIPVTNELLEDSDENIESFITEWLGKECVATENNLILAKLTAKSAKEFKNGIDSLKDAINVELGTDYAGTSVIITNDDGFNYLDKLKDADGYYLLSSVSGTAMRPQLALGANVVPIVRVPNALLKSTNVSDGTKIPFIVGDPKEAVVLYDRKQLSVKASDIAVVGAESDALNAFEEDCTILRGLARMDCCARDNDAIVNGYIKIAKAADAAD